MRIRAGAKRGQKFPSHREKETQTQTKKENAKELRMSLPRPVFCVLSCVVCVSIVYGCYSRLRRSRKERYENVSRRQARPKIPFKQSKKIQTET